MLSRLIPKPYSHLRRFFTLPSTKPFHPIFPPKQPHLHYSAFNPFFAATPKFFSTSGNNNNNGGNGNDPYTPAPWKDFRESDEKFEAFFDEGGMNNDLGKEELEGVGAGRKVNEENKEGLWLQDKGLEDEDQDAIFKGIGKEIGEEKGGVGGGRRKNEEDEEGLWLQEKGLEDEDQDAIFKGIGKEIDEEKGDVGGGHLGVGATDFKPWSLKEDEEVKADVFGIQEEDGGDALEMKGEFNAELGERSVEEVEKLEKEEKELNAIIKGPKRAFGDLLAASGITDEMLDSLIALKDFEGVEGLPPLSVIEDMRYERNTRKSTRADMERLKQEEAAKARVRQVDEKGRSYGTGRRKCSIARVWVQPGNGKFIVNDKEFDVYFPMLEHRATLLRPFSETKTLGLWDVNCTVKGGGVSGQVGAIRLGISKALQSWEPDLRPALRSAGFLTRDARVVERKKPGKAKARKSFQWVKR